MRFSRRTVMAGSLGAVGARALGAGPAFPVEEASLSELRRALDAKLISSAGLVAQYLERIERLDRHGPQLRSVIELNPDALAIAKARDAEKPRGPLHGIPVLVKDNLDTADAMKTTAGSLALLDAPTPARDSFVVQRLREAGAVLLGKTNLSEWANLRGHASTSGWSARGGLTKNPYVTTRNTSGSSSGSAVAVAASLCGAAIGTETDGSIVSPAQICGVVGFKPTVGLVSRAGIIPLSHTQDTAGPMTRSVLDAALVLDAIAGVDPRDAATAKTQLPAGGFAKAAREGSLQGARLGVVRTLVDKHWLVAPVAREALAALGKAGATLVDVELPTRAWEAAELEVLLFDLKADLDAYLAERGGPMKSLADVVAFNRAHAAEELVWFGQEFFEDALKKGPLSSPEYKKALTTCAQARADLHGVLARHQLDAVVAPTGTPAWLTDFVNGDSVLFSFTSSAAVAGAPNLSVPMGFVGELPVSLSFVGAVGNDARVLALGAAFEQVTKARKPPRYFTR
ncbi:MAG: amidase [Myxococcota bacterium]